MLSDIPKHFILLQVLLPMLNMDGQRIGKKLLLEFISTWCYVVGHLLGISSYLVGMKDSNKDEGGVEYQPTLQVRTETGQLPGGGRMFQMDPYRRKRLCV